MGGFWFLNASVHCPYEAVRRVVQKLLKLFSVTAYVYQRLRFFILSLILIIIRLPYWSTSKRKTSLFPKPNTDSELAIIFAPGYVVFLLVSLQSGRFFLEVCWLLGTSMGDGNGASPNQGNFPHVKSILESLSELQIFLHLILRSPLPHWGHWQPCLSPSSLVLSRMGGPSHFGPQAI